MSKNNQEFIMLKNMLANVATSQEHLVPNQPTQKASSTVKQDSKEISSTKKTSITPVEDTDSKQSPSTTDSDRMAKGKNQSVIDQLEKGNTQKEHVEAGKEIEINKVEVRQPDTSKKATSKKKTQKIDTQEILEDQTSDGQPSTSQANDIKKSTRGRPRGSKKKEAASGDFSIFIRLTDYEGIPSPNKDFTSIRAMSKKSDALKILYPELSKVAIYDKLATEHLQQNEKKLDEALKKKYKEYKEYW